MGLESRDTEISRKEEFERRRPELAGQPVIDSNRLRESAAGAESEPGLAQVETAKIVGRPFADSNPGGWSFEYLGRPGRIATIAAALAEGGADAAEGVFHTEEPDKAIQLTEISGPAGPMYDVADGTHRVAGAKLAGLERIPCHIRRVRYPLERSTGDANEAQDWKRKLELGLIHGTIESEPGKPQRHVLRVEGEVVPWIRTTNQNDLIRISELYEQLYPGSLEGLAIPREALVDPVANNFFMAGKWDEWKQK